MRSLRGAPHILQAGALSYRRRHSSIALEHTSLLAELARIQQRLAELEAVDPTLSAGSTTATATDSAAALFSPPKLHHINLVSRQVGELLSFYRDVMRMDEMPAEMFPRTAAGEHHTGSGFSGKIAFTTDGAMQMHLAERDLSVAFRNGRVINPIEKGHIAFRTDDIEAFKRHLENKGVPYSDYGTVFAEEWHQIFFLDPEGTVVEVHAVVS